MAQVVDQERPRRELVQAGSSGVLYYPGASCTLVGSYAEIADIMDLSIPDNARGDFKTSVIERNLRTASARANTVLGQRFKTPLAYYSETVVWAVCEIAYGQLVARRGHDPEAKTEKTIAERVEAAWSWLEAARDYEVTPDATTVQVQQESSPAVMVSDPPRGWSGPRGGSRPGLGRIFVGAGRFFR